MSPEPVDPVLRELHRAKARFVLAIQKIDAHRFAADLERLPEDERQELIKARRFNTAEAALTEHELKTLHDAADRLKDLYGS